MENEILNNKEEYDRIVKQFRMLIPIRERFYHKLRLYGMTRNQSDDRIPYKSSSYFELDVLIKRSPKGEGPQVRPTLALLDEELDLLNLGIYLIDLEQALCSAIDSAVLDAKRNQRPKIRQALNRHLIHGFRAEDTGVSFKTLKKYKDLAVIYAAQNIKYLDEHANNNTKKTVKEIIRKAYTTNPTN